MAGLSLKHIYKVYPNGTKAVNDFNMEIADKEFIVFVGPSGCGKSTTLRMIAGLEDISAGELTIGDMVVNDVEPKDRDIAMVFQNYALYPHMTVFDNVAFGLKIRKIPDIKRDKDGNPVLGKDGKPVTVMRHYTKEEVNKKVMEAAEILGITEYLPKKPKEMSGGQRQRVSLGRAIVREPKVMLLDEPLSNLDAKLRTQMRSEISKLHNKLQTTFIYVTHDQVEAMTMGTRIVVMKDGFVQQIDTPKNLYKYPGNKFVAGFIGTPQMNFFEGTLLKKGDEVEINFDDSEAVVKVPYSMMYKAKPSYLDGKQKVYIGLRAEDVSVDPEDVQKGGAVIDVKISHTEELGNQTLIYGDINMNGDGYSETPTRIIVENKGGFEFKQGEIVKAALNIGHVHLFDKETELSILPRVPEFNYFDCEVAGGKLRFCGNEIVLPEVISCGDGKGELLIPCSALTFGGTDLKVNVVETERIGDKNVVAFEVGDRRAYAVTDEEIPLGKAGINIDLKALTITINGETVVESMPQKIELRGVLIKEKAEIEVEKDGKQIKKKGVRFMLDVAGYKMPCPDRTVDKIITVIGVKNAFTDSLIYECSPYDLKISEEGIAAEFVKTVDYGREQFALCKVGDKEIYVSYHGENTENIRLEPDIDKIAVIQESRHIRIV